MTVDELAQESASLIRWLDERLNDMPLSSDLRHRLAGGSFYIVFEHHRAVVTLIAGLHYTTARAVMRPIFETYVRGLWLWHCATQREIERFEKHDIEKKSFVAILEAVEAVKGFEGKTLSAIKARFWKPMNAYVHSGFQQIVRHQTEEAIEVVNDPEEAKELLVFANLMGCMAAVLTAGLSGRTELKEAIVDRMETLWAPLNRSGANI